MANEPHERAKELMTDPQGFMLSFDAMESSENPDEVCAGINAALAAAGSNIRAILHDDSEHGAVHIVSDQRTELPFPPRPVSYERPHALPESFFDVAGKVHPSSLLQTDQIIRHLREREKEGDRP